MAEKKRKIQPSTLLSKPEVQSVLSKEGVQHYLGYVCRRGEIEGSSKAERVRKSIVLSRLCIPPRKSLADIAKEEGVSQPEVRRNESHVYLNIMSKSRRES